MNVPFQLKQIDHVVLRIKDLDASMRFYRDVLGCSMDKVQETIGLWQMRAGSSLIDLVPVDGVLGKIGGAPAGLEGHNVDHVALQVTPWNEGAIRDHLGANGIAIVDSGPRYGAEGTGPSIYILDPDGTTVELKGPPND
ncbi:MAG TPA: VOC family protein [Bradyrhizobium sp.]